MKRIISVLLTALLLLGTLCGVLTVSAAEDNTVTPADPDALAGELMEEVSDLQHPYVFYSKDDIPALREKVKQGVSKKAYGLLEASAPAFSTRGLTVAKGANGVIGRQLQHYVSYVAIYAAIADRADLAKNVVNLVISCANQGSVEVYNSINGALCIGDFGHAYALAYDMLYEYMTDDQRALVKAEMEEIGTWIFENSAAVDTWGSQEARRKAWNWNAVTHGALGMIALALGDHEEWMSLAIERMEGYYEYAVDADGAAMEGLHYIGYAFNSWAPMGHAIYRLSGVEIMDAYPQMQQMPYWYMYVTAPHGGEQARINQGSSMGNYASSFYIINRYKQSDALWGWLYGNNVLGNKYFGSEYQGNGWSAPQVILYEDQSFTYTEPTEENNSLIKTFEKGLVSARDSWDNDAAMVTFTCGYGQSGCWNHPDDNSFTFYAKGESFIIDLGEGRLNSSDHNVLLVDGKGMHFTGGSTMVKGELQANMILEDGSLYLRGNNLSSYLYTNLKASIRHLVFGGGDTPFVLIFDYARTDGKEHNYSTNFYTSANNTVKVDESGKFATITGSRNKEVCYVIPYAGEGNVSLHTDKVGNNAITTENVTSSMHLQATLFITANPDGSMPQIEFSTESKAVTVSVTKSEGGEETTQSYVFRFGELVSPGEMPETEPATTEAPTEATTEAPTEAPTEVTTESPAEATETDAKVETEGKTDSVAETKAPAIEDLPEDSTDGETKSNQSSSGGCNSTVGAGSVLATAVASAFFICKKKKRK